MDQADTVYGRRPWNSRPDQEQSEEGLTDAPYNYLGPYENRNQQILGQALASVATPSNVLGDVVRPPLTQVQLFRPRYGYRSRQIGIEDIMDVDAIYAEPRTELGGAATTESTSRNSFGNGTY
jgi:hypothetical protein